ncbi:hypothetical protein PoB_007675200 [Plakobranchus ocellatus]|uniref:Uncharacterized protein n=1 Tax=Plakobranchus ocellatus TaxID=259542 RepID=A0AAV4E0Y4_9GAST|nr:hypothetical protein PoB_007675200 [Plakobranchus ocellatus]
MKNTTRDKRVIVSGQGVPSNAVMLPRMPLGECHLPAPSGPMGNQDLIIEEPCVTKMLHPPEPLACTSMTPDNTHTQLWHQLQNNRQ